MAERKRGNNQAAKAYFLQDLAADPNDAGALEGAALACMALGQHKEARTYLERWNAISPNKPYILDLLERAKKGEAGPVQAKPAPPPVAISLYDVGTEARRRGDHNTAKQAFAQMLAQNPDDGGALEGIALACLSLGQYSQAAGYLEHWNQLEPHSQYIEGLLARAKAGPPIAAPPTSPQPVTAAAPQPAAVPQPPQSSPLPEPSLYEVGTAERRHGDNQAAKETFAKMLAKDPENGAALEGLSLACLSLGQYEEARGHLQTWNAKSPHNPYILGLLARAQRGAGDTRGAARANVEIVDLDPKDLGLRRRVDDFMWTDEPGLFTQDRIRKSIGTEELNTANPQRIVYEGRTGGLRIRVRANQKLNFTGGAEFAEDAQRNDTHGFTYFDILEQIYWMGFEARPRRNLFFSGEYGQDVMANAKAAGLDGQTLFSRARLAARAQWLDADWAFNAERAPYFLRGSGTSTFFALRRDDSAKLQVNRDFLGWTVTVKTGIDVVGDKTDVNNHGTTLDWWSLLGTKETGPWLLQPGYSHGQQVFFGATPGGRLTYVATDRYGGRLRYLVDQKYQFSGGAGYTFYWDANRAVDANFDATAWLPWFKELSGGYRYSYLDFLAAPQGYNDTNTTDHWLFAYWDHRWFAGPWSRFGYEHGFRWDGIRRHYDASEWLGDIECYHRADFSLKIQGRYGVSTVNDKHHSLGLQARYSFQ